MTMFESRAARASCPGCGSPLPLEGDQALFTCPYCESSALQKTLDGVLERLASACETAEGRR